MKAILAGLLIGIGNIAMLSVDNRYLGALLFSVALLSIIKLELPLYTGRIGKVFKYKNPIECLYIFVFNVYGVLLITILYSVLSSGFEAMEIVAQAKFSHTHRQLFIAGFLCNVLITVAVNAKDTAITILCIMCFILCGFEHSIADAMYFSMSYGNFMGWIMVILGNTIGAMVTEFILTIGEKK